MKKALKAKLYKKWKETGSTNHMYFWNAINKTSNEYNVKFVEVQKAVKEFRGGWQPEELIRVPGKSDVVTEICICDLHIPYHDPVVVDLVLEFIKDVKPDKVKILGDLVDFYGISIFNKDPERESSLQREIDVTKGFFDKLSPLCEDIAWLEGNHERRLKRFKWQNACINSIEALDMSNLFDCDYYNIKYTDADVHYKEIMFSHGRGVSEKELVHKFSGYTAKNLLDANGISGVSGHTHRLGVHYRTKRDGARVWAELGCLCDTQPEYIKGKPDWQQAFGVITFKGDKFSINPVSINKNDKGRPFFFYGGQLYE